MQVHSKGVNIELVANLLLDLDRKSKGILVGVRTAMLLWILVKLIWSELMFWVIINLIV